VPSTDKDYAEAVNNFIKSVAGYCGTLCSVVPCVVCVVRLVCVAYHVNAVATYVLGIGDRHNDNMYARKRAQA
jgi:hypothetical protein